MKSDFGRYIDHTLLRPIGTTTDIRKLCTEAIEYGMSAVCIFPSYIPMARDLLKDTRVKIATVIAFPFGVTFTEIKEAEMNARIHATSCSPGSPRGRCRAVASAAASPSVR